MPDFTITGDIDPFLHVALAQGEKIYCESGAMVMLETNLELRGQMSGGLGSAIMRRFANGESFFQQQIEALRGAGDCLLSPALPGAIRLLDVGATQYCLNDGAFVAATAGTAIKAKMQSIGNALFAKSGGFFIMHTSGTGQVAVSGFGSLFELQVTPDKEVVIDNAHVVCWDSALDYTISLTTGAKGSGVSGMLGNLVNSVTSGEGVVLRFSGAGKVLICSRNREAFVEWMQKEVAGERSSR
jgi:uncharacterized protein (TIGR00266 family)